MSEAEVAEFFEGNTGEYAVDWKDGNDEKIEFINERMGDINDINMLDIGCGSGAFADQIAKSFDTSHAYGTEVTKDMFSEQFDNASFLLAEGRNLPFPSQKFDLVHMDTVLHHIVGESRRESKESAEEAFSEMFRILKPGGYLLLTEQIKRGRILSDKGLSYVIFYGLKYGSKLMHPLHPQIHKDQPPVCFFTFDEIESMINKNSGELLEKDVFPHHSLHLLEKPLQLPALRVTFYIRKKTN